MPCPNCPCRSGGNALPPMDGQEKALLAKLGVYAYLPICRLVARNTLREQSYVVVAAPLYLEEPHTPASEAEDVSRALQALYTRGYVTLDYQLPLQGYDYSQITRTDYVQELLWRYQLPLSTLEVDQGSACLTLQGQEALEDAELA